MLPMRQSYRIIPIYTADVSGVCSALYELGGMTVMHDPSGCNSTYNTHDEIRWYDQDSLIFISGLTEIDAIMGNDRKFIDDIEHAARELHPKFIALAGSPIPFMNGTDFPAIARVIETETGIPTFAVPTNGMHDYVYGAGIALEEIAKRFVGKLPVENRNSESTDKGSMPTEKLTGKTIENCYFEKKTEERKDNSENQHANACSRQLFEKHSVNLLGVTPLDFGPQKKVDILKENLQKNGWEVLSTWAMGDDLETLQRAGEASVNLVVSAVGLRAAKVLQEKLGTPYVIGAPVCTELFLTEKDDTKAEIATDDLLNGCKAINYTEEIVQALNETLHKRKENEMLQIPYLHNRIAVPAEITLIGEPVTMGSLAAAIEKKYGRSVRVLCPLKDCESLIGSKDAIVLGEEAMEEALKDAQIIVADPLYRPICPKESTFYELPHVAFSGRIFV